jgi:hypothetical protein
MAVGTKYGLAERALRIINGGNIPVASKVHINEVKLAVEQVTNKMLKMEYLNVNIPSMELIPNGASVATYEGITVEQYGTSRSKSTLPAMPLKLPRGIGVYQIFDPANMDCPFIPLEMGQWGLLKTQPLINNLLGQVGYEWYGMDIIYTSDLTQPSPVEVTMRLVVLDISQYSDYDILPLPSDMQWDVIQEVVKMFAAEPVADKLVDPSSNNQVNVPIPQQAQS